jgi:WD40 repeat protein
MVQYELKKALVKHGDSVNTLAFSYDGSLFASGADDGLIIIFKGNGSGQEFRRFQVKAPVTTLLWRSRFGYTIVAGDTSGDVHTICLSDSTRVCIPLCYFYDDKILFTGKCILSYREPRAWPSPLHRAKSHIASHQLRKCCTADQAGNYWSVSFTSNSR